eukprot:1160656-Pelagomonas_calceolata.AAC.1
MSCSIGQLSHSGRLLSLLLSHHIVSNILKIPRFADLCKIISGKAVTSHTILLVLVGLVTLSIPLTGSKNWDLTTNMPLHLLAKFMPILLCMANKRFTAMPALEKGKRKLHRQMKPPLHQLRETLAQKSPESPPPQNYKNTENVNGDLVGHRKHPAP